MSLAGDSKHRVWQGLWRMPAPTVALLAVALLLPGCSVRRFAINRVAGILSSGTSSVFESEEDLALAGGALPFGIKLLESLLAETPEHRGLLLATCRAVTLYTYGWVDFPAEVLYEQDIHRARAERARAHRLYQRAFGYCQRGLDVAYPGFASRLAREPEAAVAVTEPRNGEADVPYLYWSAATLGLTISTDRNDPALLARLPEARALLGRALALDEDWDRGALHELQLQLIAAEVGATDFEAIDHHYRRALELSGGDHPGLFVSYAEAVAVPRQDRALFVELLQRALDFDPERAPRQRVQTELAQRRARWLLDRIDDLILE